MNRVDVLSTGKVLARAGNSMPRVNFSRHQSLCRRLSRSHQRRLLLLEGSCYFSRFLDFCTFRQPEKWTKENTNLTPVISTSILLMTQTFSDTKLSLNSSLFFLWENGPFQIRTVPGGLQERDGDSVRSIVLQIQVNIKTTFSLVSCLWLVLVSCRRGFLKSEEIAAKSPWRDQPKNAENKREQVHFQGL